MFVTVTILFVFIWLLFIKQQKSKKRPKNFPPGPGSWPILGNLWHIGMEPFKHVLEMKKKYGDIIAIDLGIRRSIFINDYKVLNEAFNMPVFCGRPRMDHFSYQNTGEFRGIGFTNGPTWVKQRRLAFSYIQSGMRNGTTMESLIMNEVKEVVESLKKKCGIPLDTENIFHFPTINALWVIIAGQRFEADDEDLQKIIRHSSNITKSTLIQGILVFFSAFSKFFPNLSGYNQVQRDLTAIQDVMDKIIDEHKRTYKEGIQRDFIDHYIHKMNIMSAEDSKINEQHLATTLEELFIGGTDTVATALHWIIFLMAHHPKVQDKLIKTIQQELGTETWPKVEDRSRLSYVEAVICEALRFSTMVAVGLFHATLEDVEFHGYNIPKGTIVVANLRGMHYDKKYWNNPEDFEPDRFLTENGLELKRHGTFVPFSVGRRNCPGEALGKDELFLFTTSLFQHFRVEFEPSVPKPLLQKFQISFMLLPLKHRIVFHAL